MKREKEELRELVEPDQDAGSSASVQGREPWGTGADPDGYQAFGDLLVIPRSHTHRTRKGRHMQRTRNIMTESREGTPGRFRPRPGKGTRRDKQKEKDRYRGKKRDYYEYEDRRDEDEYSERDGEDECTWGNDEDRHIQRNPDVGCTRINNGDDRDHRRPGVQT